MGKLQLLHSEHGQSPWLDNLTRSHVSDGTLQRMVDDGIRGVTANPTIIANAISSSADYDEQFASLTSAGRPVEDAYWQLVMTDAVDALALLRPVFDAADGEDGFVSVEVAPGLAGNTQATVTAATWLQRRIGMPNLMVKIPATSQGIPAIETMTAAGHSINITLIFSLDRYAEVVEAYLRGLERFTAGGGDPAQVHSVASFFVSRVDTEVDRRLELLGTPDALTLRGRAGIAQAKLAYRLFTERFSSGRWRRLQRLGGHVQRPLWASTSTKNPSYRDTRYVDELIGRDTVNTLPEPTILAFEDHGRLGDTLKADVGESVEVIGRLTALGIDLDDVGRDLTEQGVSAFQRAFRDVLARLEARTAAPSRR
jgi:transaldolase